MAIRTSHLVRAFRAIASSRSLLSPSKSRNPRAFGSHSCRSVAIPRKFCCFAAFCLFSFFVGGGPYSHVLGGHRGCPPRRGPLLHFAAVSLRLVPVLLSPRADLPSVPDPRRAAVLTTPPRPATMEGLKSTRHRAPPRRFLTAKRHSSAALAARFLGAAFASHVPYVLACLGAHRRHAGLTARSPMSRCTRDRRPSSTSTTCTSSPFVAPSSGASLRPMLCTLVIAMPVFSNMHPAARMRAVSRTLARAAATAPAATKPAAAGVDCSGQPEGLAEPGALLENLRGPALPGGDALASAPPCWFSRAHLPLLAARLEGGALQARVVR